MPKTSNNPVLSIRLHQDASPRTSEGKAFRIVQARLQRGQTASEILLEAILSLEGVPSPRESWMNEIKETLQKVIEESLSNIEITGQSAAKTHAETASSMASTAINRLKKLAHLTEDDDDE